MKKLMVFAVLMLCSISGALEPVPDAIVSTDKSPETIALLTEEEYRTLLAQEKSHNELERTNYNEYIENLRRIDKALEDGFSTQEAHDSAIVTSTTMYDSVKTSLIASRPTPQSVRAETIARVEAANAEELASLEGEVTP